MNIMDESQDYSIDDLELIIATQQDLYTPGEMNQLKQQLEQKYQAREVARKAEEEQKQAKMKASLPQMIACHKCGGMNPFHNTTCTYCGVKLDRSKYFSDFYQAEDPAPGQIHTDREPGYGFHYFMSFLIPFFGLILGAIMMGNTDRERESVGKGCVLLALLSVVVYVLACIAVWG